MSKSNNILDCSSSIAIIVTFNPDVQEFLEFCDVLSIQFSCVVVVDNNSDNINLFKSKISEFKNFNIILNSSNLGLAFAQNQGVKYAIENNFESFCMFDQDSKVDSSYLVNIINDYNGLVLNGFNVGSLGPVIVDQTSGIHYPAVRYNGFFLNRVDLDEVIIDCSFIIASGSITKISTFVEVGWFYNEFFINYIDIEWCFRAISIGYGIFMTPNVKLYQNVGLYRKNFLGRSIPVHSPLRRYYASRNSTIMLYFKHVSIGYKFREIILNPVRVVFDCLVAGNSIIRIKLFFKGFIDGIQNR